MCKNIRVPPPPPPPWDEPSLLEKKVNSNYFLCSQLLSKCRMLITFENSSGPTKCSADNACMCSLVSALAAREESVIVIHAIFFSAYLLLLVVSADNLFKQLGHSSGPAKLFFARICVYEVSYEPNSLLERKIVYFFNARFLSLIICPLLVFFIAVSVFAGMRLCAVSY